MGFPSRKSNNAYKTYSGTQKNHFLSKSIDGEKQSVMKNIINRCEGEILNQTKINEPTKKIKL